METSVRPVYLARWLADQLQHPSRNTARDVLPARLAARLAALLRAFALACLNHPMQDPRLPLAPFVRHQHPLMQRLTLRIDKLRETAGRSAFRQLVLHGAWQVEASPQLEFRFDLHGDPVAWQQALRRQVPHGQAFLPRGG